MCHQRCTSFTFAEQQNPSKRCLPLRTDRSNIPADGRIFHSNHHIGQPYLKIINFNTFLWEMEVHSGYIQLEIGKDEETGRKKEDWGKTKKRPNLSPGAWRKELIGSTGISKTVTGKDPNPTGGFALLILPNFRLWCCIRKHSMSGSPYFHLTFRQLISELWIIWYVMYFISYKDCASIKSHA